MFHIVRSLLFVAAIALATCVAGHATANQVVDQLSRAGANELALVKLTADLESLPVDSANWLVLKRKQVELMNARGLYNELAEQLHRDIGQSQAPAHKRWLQNQEIAALLAAGEPLTAINRIRVALWQNAASYGPEVLDAIANWRRQLVEARVMAEQFDLAADTLARYENDYQIESDVSALRPGIQRWPWQYQPRFNQELKRSRARLFLESGAFDIAADLLKEDEHASVQHVRLLSLLRTGQMPAADVYAQAVVMAESKALNWPARKSAWVLAAEAAGQTGQVPEHIQAIKAAMITSPELPFSEALLSLSTTQSWEALVAAGNTQLSAWPADFGVQAIMAKLSEQTLGLEEQQAVLAALYTRSSDAQQQSQLLSAMLNLETDAQVRRYLLPSWMLENAAVDASQLSPALRYQLTELLLEAGNIPQAAELMSQLDVAPAEVSAVEWQLRRARVLVLAAKAEQGAAVLQQLLAGAYGEQPNIDRFLQAVFDLQAVGSHDAAIRLFQTLLSGDLQARQRREIHYWLADAAKAAESYELAAEHYLLSAGENNNSWDQWGQSARRQAADSLKSAGLLADAINVYQRLLDRSQDRTERAVLRTNIQRLKAQL